MQSTIPMISPRALHQMAVQGQTVRLVDVRNHAEYALSHAAGAVSVPLDQIDVERVNARLGAVVGTRKPLYLICASGRRAEQAARKLQAEGMHNLVLVDGGTQAWEAHQLPVHRHSRVPSLERQTQISLGLLILLMLAKGAFLHPLFYALVALLGVGLVVSGITARCGLAALLARMPWNRPGAEGTASSA